MKANQKMNYKQPVPGSHETQFDGVDRSKAPFYKKLAAGITSETAIEILADEAQ